MTPGARALALAVALGAAGWGAGCASIPAPLPMWATDTLEAADLDSPRPVTLAPKPAPAASTAMTSSELAPVPDQPAGYGGPDGEATAWVESELKDRGLRFGTDGTVGSLYAYVRGRHGLVAAGQARPGDVVFFDLGGRARCGDHAGVVDQVDADGRIAFREARGGVVRLSYAHPGQPYARRSADGRLLNSFLRIRREDDPPGARYLAGQMLCAVGRVDRPERRRPTQRLRVSGL